MEENKNSKNVEGKKELDPEQALNTLNNLYNRYATLEEVREANRTERERIQAEKEKALAQIEATQTVLITYLNRSFDERATIFKKDFEAIDTAIANNNMEALAIMVQNVNTLAAQSPFKALVDLAQVKRNFLTNDEVEI